MSNALDLSGTIMSNSIQKVWSDIFDSSSSTLQYMTNGNIYNSSSFGQGTVVGRGYNGLITNFSGFLPDPGSLPIRNVTKSRRYAYLEAALSDASKGDIIEFDPGLYKGTVNLSRRTNLTIRASDWAVYGYNDTTILKGNRIQPVVSLSNAFKCRIIGFTVEAGSFGVFSSANSPNSNYIAHNVIRTNTIGIGVTNGNFNTITSNSIAICSNGVFITGTSRSNNIHGNTIYSNRRYGVCINDEDSDYNRVRKNSIFANRDTGVLLSDADFTIISRNNIYFNTNYGCQLQNVPEKTMIATNAIYSNGGNQQSEGGIGLQGGLDTTILSNRIFGNRQSQMYNSSCNRIRFLRNLVSGGDYGIYLNNAPVSNLIKGNRIIGQTTSGIRMIWGADRFNCISSNQIVGIGGNYGIYACGGYNNTITNNRIVNWQNGVYVGSSSGCSNHSVLNNYITSNSVYGIVLSMASKHLVKRNVLFRNAAGILVDNAAGMIVNNTIARSTSGNGILWQNTSGGQMQNNIFLSNAAYGARRTSSGPVVAGYNDFYGNTLDPTNGGITWNQGNLFGNPRLNASSTYVIASAFSAAVDTATNMFGEPFQGNAPDMGWRESAYTMPVLPRLVDSLQRLDGAPGTTYDTACGDLDGDGDVDVVYGNSGLTNSQVFLNNGTGFYTFRQFLSRKFTPSVLIMDVDRDGDLDIVQGCGSSPSDKNIVWLNDGAANFTESSNFGLGYCLSLCKGDIDNDGDLDIIEGQNPSTSDNGSRIYTNNNGVYRFKETIGFFGLLSLMYNLLVDVNKDGALDYIAAYDSGTMQTKVMTNNGKGTFTYWGNLSAEMNYTYEIAAGDIDNDSDIDFVQANSNTGTRIIVNNWPAAFSISQTLPETNGPTRSVKLGDINNDGSLDLIEANERGSLIYTNNGSGVFSMVTTTTLSKFNAFRLAFADGNDDSDLDVHIATATTNLVYTNKETKYNNPPFQPFNLTAVTQGLSVTLNWSRPSDDRTPSKSLTYNLFIQDFNGRICYYAEDIPGGILNNHTPSAGNLWTTTNIRLTGLRINNYTWGVQAVDSGYRRSVWSIGQFRIGSHSGPFYVHKNLGSDSNDGTSVNPFRTIQKAVDVMSAGYPQCSVPAAYIAGYVYTNRITIRSNLNPGSMTLAKWSNTAPVIWSPSAILSSNYCIMITNADRIVVRDFIFSGSSNQILIKKNSRNNVIRNSSFMDSRGAGVCVFMGAGPGHLIFSNYFHVTGAVNYYQKGSVAIMTNCKFVRVLNNTFYSNLMSSSGTPIRISAASSNTVKFNTAVSNNKGILVEGLSLNNQVVSNILFYSGQISLAGIENIAQGNRVSRNTGGQGINVLGRGNVVFENMVYSNGSGIYQSSSVATNSVISNNYLFNNAAHGILTARRYTRVVNNRCAMNLLTGIYMGGKHEYVSGNTMVTNGVGLKIFSVSNVLTNNMIAGSTNNGSQLSGSYNKIYDLSVINSRRTGMWGVPGQKANRFVRLLVFRSGMDGLNLQGTTNTSFYHCTIVSNLGNGVVISNRASTNIIMNSIIAYNGNYGIYKLTGGGGCFTNFRYNDLYMNSAGNVSGCALGPSTTTADPFFESLDSGSANLCYLLATSPCINTATNIIGISGVYAGSGPDKGFFEYGGDVNHGPFYVDDNTGDDSFSGSRNTPFKTVQRAALAMMTGAPYCTSATAFVFPGTYQEKVTIQSNKNTGLMVFTALSNDRRPHLTGAAITNYGFYLTNAKKVMIAYLNIKNFNRSGIYLAGSSSNNCILNNKVFSNGGSGFGIYLNSDFADKNLIFRNNVFGPNQATGLYIANGDYNTVRSNQFHNNNNNGMYLYITAQYNRICENSIYSNDGLAGIYGYSDGCSRNSIYSNDIWGLNQTYGIYLVDSDYNFIRDNRIHHNEMHGIYLKFTTQSNIINRNLIYSNELTGIKMDDGGGGYFRYNFICSNRISGLNQDYGIQATNNVYYTRIYRNLFVMNATNALNIAGYPLSTRIFNNTVIGSRSDGILLANTAAVTLYNNIIMLNGTAAGNYGLRYTGTAIAYVAFNDFYNNFSGPVQGTVTWGNGNRYTDPLLDTITSYTIISFLSAAVDSATNILNEPYQGLGLDMGWKESPYIMPQPVHNITRSKDYLTINAAVADLSNNNQLRIDPGIYNEVLHLARMTNIQIEARSFVNGGTNTNTVIIGVSSTPVIAFSNCFNINIRGFSARNGSYGVFSLGSSPNSNYIAHMNITGVGIGVGITNGDFNTVTSNQIYQCTNGIYIIGTSRSNAIFSNNISRNMNGVFIADAKNNFIRFNEVRSNQVNGIYLSGTAEGNSLGNNRIYSNTKAGLHLAGRYVRNNLVISNSIFGLNQSCGIFLTNTCCNYIQKSNKIYRNQYGIYGRNAVTSNVFAQNRIYSNSTTYGIRFNDGANNDNTFISNDIFRHGMGIQIGDDNRNNFLNNRIYNQTTVGLMITGYGESTRVSGNQFYSNNLAGPPNAAIVINGSVRNIYVISNSIYNQYNGITFNGGGMQNFVRNNRIHGNYGNGILIWGTTTGDIRSNYIAQNEICSNTGSGICFFSGVAKRNVVVSNVIFGPNQQNGIAFSGGTNNKVYRNLIKNNSAYGICSKSNAREQVIVNNTIFRSMTGDGVFFTNSTSGTMYNNIILSNGDGAGDYGIQNAGTGLVYAGYNDLYGNGAGPTNGLFLWGAKNIMSDPMLDTAMSCTISSAASPAVDTGTTNTAESKVYIGYGPDLGWKESPFIIINKGPFYVDDEPAASDSNPGTFNMPFRTIQRAANVMMPGAPGCTSATTYIFPGVYQDRITVYSNRNPGWMIFTKLSNTQPLLYGSYLTNTGIKITNAANVIISGLAVSSFSNGIFITGVSTNNAVRDCRVYSNELIGIRIGSEDADRNLIFGNSIYGTNQFRGIFISRGDRNVILSNSIFLNSSGVEFTTSAVSNRLVGNNIYSNNIDGFYCWSATAGPNSILSNTIWGASQNIGVEIRYASGYLVANNIIREHSSYGVVLALSAFSNLIRDNTISSNVTAGVYIGCDGNEIITNDIHGPGQISGVYLNSADANVVRLNRVADQGSYGIHIAGSSYSNHVARNFLAGNGTSGVFFNGASAGRNRIGTNQIRGPGQSYGVLMTAAGILNLIFSNQICNNADTGVSMGTARSNVIDNNVICSNRQRGIGFGIDTADQNTITGNSIWGTKGEAGISLSLGDHNILRYNNIYKNSNYGLLFINGAKSNQILKNTIYSNYACGIALESDQEDGNRIMTNDIWGTVNGYGIRIAAGDMNIFSSNRIHNNLFVGVNFYSTASSNVFSRNLVYSNQISGISVNGSGFADNTLSSNIVFGPDQNYGFYFNGVGGKNIIIQRNLIRHNDNYGIYLNAATNIKVINNTIFRSIVDDGVIWQNTSSGTLYNNIILSNGDGAGDYGIENAGTGLVYADFNNVYTNGGGKFLNVTPGPNNRFSDPLLETTTSFTIMSPSSPAVDSGTTNTPVSKVY
ncbi:MAG: right-handed parallel beta-helix repeat-containing protein, partial [bacterium]|nr:right-handed parallel beta-helix repeat-containing protein [bacterium]